MCFMWAMMISAYSGMLQVKMPSSQCVDMRSRKSNMWGRIRNSPLWVLARELDLQWIRVQSKSSTRVQGLAGSQCKQGDGQVSRKSTRRAGAAGWFRRQQAQCSSKQKQEKLEGKVSAVGDRDWKQAYRCLECRRQCLSLETRVKWVEQIVGGSAFRPPKSTLVFSSMLIRCSKVILLAEARSQYMAAQNAIKFRISIFIYLSSDLYFMASTRSTSRITETFSIKSTALTVWRVCSQAYTYSDREASPRSSIIQFLTSPMMSLSLALSSIASAIDTKLSRWANILKRFSCCKSWATCLSWLSYGSRALPSLAFCLVYTFNRNICVELTSLSVGSVLTRSISVSERRLSSLNFRQGDRSLLLQGLWPELYLFFFPVQLELRIFSILLSASRPYSQWLFLNGTYSSPLTCTYSSTAELTLPFSATLWWLSFKLWCLVLRMLPFFNISPYRLVIFLCSYSSISSAVCRFRLQFTLLLI